MLCPCGSGLSAARCCALIPDAFPTIADLPLPDPTPAHCRAILELSPYHPAALLNLARHLRPAPAAEILLHRLLSRDPNHLDATQTLAALLLDRGAREAAEIQARNAIRLAPRNAQSHYLLGLAVTEAGAPHTGEAEYRRALTYAASRDPALLANLAWSLKLQGRFDEARALYREATAAAPALMPAWLGWARLEEADRDYAAAATCLGHAERLAPDAPAPRLLRAVLHDRIGAPATALATLDALPEAALGVEERLQRGRLLDRLGRHDEAFAAWTSGKALWRETSGQTYRAEAAAALADHLSAFFTRARLATLPRAAPRPDAATPVVIRGFPRSGTTLAEQMLSAHGSLTPGGELPLIGALAELMPRLLAAPLAYPEALAELWMADAEHGLDDLRDHYLRRRDRLLPTKPLTPFVTDKMPLNETHLGLICLLFPTAPLLRLQRHPLDVVLSVFAHQLTHGFHCATDLAAAATHYALIADLQDHYAATLDRAPHVLRYEALVADPAPALAAALDQAGLTLEPECLALEANRRYAPTASYAQVTEPLNTRGIFRWRHSRRHLEPVLPILAPLAERLGYDVD